jgi:hypothetical protein
MEWKGYVGGVHVSVAFVGYGKVWLGLGFCVDGLVCLVCLLDIWVLAEWAFCDVSLLMRYRMLVRFGYP